jgi:hypothetical protein
MSMSRPPALALVPLALLAGCEVSFLDFYFDVPGTTSSTGSSVTSSTAGSGGGMLCTPGAMATCYDGPAGTEGVGICHAGARTCAVDGLGWSACMGEVLPQMEDCTTPTDENCDGTTPPCPGTVSWARQFGDASNQVVSAVAVDAAGNVIVTGYFFGSVDFGGGALMSTGGSDVFVAKLDAVSGGHIWSKRFGDAASQAGMSLAVDAAGDVIVIGNFSGAIDFGGGALTSNGGSDVFAAKLDSASGLPIWSKRFGGAGDQFATGVVVDPTGSLVLTGYFSGKVDFGGGPLLSTGVSDAYIAKLDTNGGYLWAKHFGGPAAFTDGRSVAVDTTGDILVTGGFSNVVDFGGGSLMSTGTSDAYLAKLDTNGGYLWCQHFGSPGTTTDSWGLAADGLGNALLAGDFSGTLNFGDGALISKSTQEAYAAKVGVAGWSERFGAGVPSNVSTSNSLVIDAQGNVLVAGTFTGAVDFGAGQLMSAGSTDVFLAKRGSGGDPVWSRRFGDSADQRATGVAVDAANNVVLVGSFSGSMVFDSTLLVSAGGSDVFVAKLGP